MNYTNKLLTNSIGYMLKKEFGNEYKYYSNVIPQKLVKPMFFVRRVSNINQKELSNSQFIRERNITTMLVRFFPQEMEDLQHVQDIWGIEERLTKLFRYINLTTDGVDSVGAIVVHRINTEEVDGSLQLMMDLTVHTVELTESQKINILELEVKLKED